MFFAKPIGIFAVLDEETHFPKATDETLTAKYKANIKIPDYVPLKTDDAGFSIKHYAGIVEYV